MVGFIADSLTTGQEDRAFRVPPVSDPGSDDYFSGLLLASVRTVSSLRGLGSEQSIRSFFG